MTQIMNFYISHSKEICLEGEHERFRTNSQHQSMSSKHFRRRRRRERDKYYSELVVSALYRRPPPLAGATMGPLLLIIVHSICIVSILYSNSNQVSAIQPEAATTRNHDAPSSRVMTSVGDHRTLLTTAASFEPITSSTSRQSHYYTTTSALASSSNNNDDDDDDQNQKTRRSQSVQVGGGRNKTATSEEPMLTMSYNELDENLETRDKLLRKLSSTMLLESLLFKRGPPHSNNRPSLIHLLSLPTLEDATKKAPINSRTNVDESENINHMPSAMKRNTTSSKHEKFNKNNNKRNQIPIARPTKRTSLLLEAATNQSNSISERHLINEDDEINEDVAGAKANKTKENSPPPSPFSHKSLNYLVEKLISFSTPSLGGLATPSPPVQSRPPSRFKPSQLLNRPTQITSINLNLNNSSSSSSSQAPALTLDMLIKDEYDSRVQPMYEQLNQQRNLSLLSNAGPKRSTSRTGAADKTKNHRLDDAITSSEATTSLSTSSSQNRNNFKLVSPTPVVLLANNTTTGDGGYISSNVSISADKDGVEPDEYEESSSGDGDDDKSSDSSEDDDSDSADRSGGSGESDVPETTTTTAPKMKKILKNVPPYQLGSGFTGRPELQTQISQSTQPMDSDSSGSDEQRQTTTTAAPLSMTSHHHQHGIPTIGAAHARKSLGQTSVRPSSGDKATDASSRDSLVFSDGATEAERRANGNQRKDIRPSQRVEPNHRQGGGGPLSQGNKARNEGLRGGDSFLLNQLFSTISPLTDLNSKLNIDQTSHGLREGGHMAATNTRQVAPNPLIYKGYVGKDDYLLSTTSSDWSRPISNSRDGASTRYLTTTTTTTPTPATEPPTVPYNYYLNQPITNAQSVPAMVIPTSDRPPTLAGNMLSYEQQQQQPPSHLTPVVATSLQNFTSNRMLSKERKYSYQLPDDKELMPLQQTGQRADQLQHHQNNTNGPRGFSPAIVRESSLTNNSSSGRSWSPTKANHHQQQIETTSMTTTPYQTRLQQQHHHHNNTNIIAIGGTNTSSPMVFPLVVEAKNRTSSGGVSNQIDDSDGTSNVSSDSGGGIGSGSRDDFGGDNSNGSIVSDSGEFASERNRANIGKEGFSHAKPTTTRLDGQRNNKSSRTASSQAERGHGGEMGRDDEQDRNIRVPTSSVGVVYGKNNNNNYNNNKRPGNDTLHHESDNDYENDNAPTNGSKSAAQGAAGGSLRKSLQAQNKNRGAAAQQQQHQMDELPADNNNVSQSRGASKLHEAQMNQNQVPKRAVQLNTKFINHEPAGSEMTQTGVERLGATRQPTSMNGLGGSVNQTGQGHYVRFQQPKRSSESILIGANGDQNPVSSQDQQQPPMDQPYRESVTGSGITSDRPNGGVSSNPNFYSEASYERPVMDNSVSMFPNGPNIAPPSQLPPPHRGGHRHQLDDPYQRTTSNIVLSTVQHHQQQPPVSTTLATPTLTTTTVGGDVSGTLQAGGGAVGGSDAARPTGKSSNDRLAFILIGGSCVLSVVCLVLAAMSMRCQDMCDDYQSLRNAERAALKLQKHRLKFTKSHQINKFNHGLGGGGSSGSGQNLIDDFMDNNNNNNNSSSGAGRHGLANGNDVLTDLGGQSRNLRFQTNAKSIQFTDSALKSVGGIVVGGGAGGGVNEPNWNQAASNAPQVLNGSAAAAAAAASTHHNNQWANLVAADGAGGAMQVCGCENCTNRRLMLHDDFVLSNSKHLSWLHPYYHLQHPMRFRPLFGAGSSVSTFFPQNHLVDRGSRAVGGANSVDATAGLIEQTGSSNKQTVVGHSCGGAIGRSKSILSKSKNFPLNSSSSRHHANNLHHHHHQDHHVSCGAGTGGGLSNVLESTDSIEQHDHHASCCHHKCHNHNHHSHHHHHHQNHSQDSNNDTTASEESETTVDDGPVHCEHHLHCEHHCSREHQTRNTDMSSRVKLIQMAKLNSQLSSGWKKQSTGGGGGAQTKHLSAGHGHANNNQNQSHNHHQQSSQHNHHHHQQHIATTGSDSSHSLPQCTCAHQPLISTASNHNGSRSHKTSQLHHHLNKRDTRENNNQLRQQAKRDKSMLIWSTNRDRLI